VLAGEAWLAAEDATTVGRVAIFRTRRHADVKRDFTQ
jgi:hypothetical protein